MEQSLKLTNSDQQFPFVSIVIPVYNDPDGLADTLKSLLNQDYPSGKWEIIVVDNHSTDNTPNVAKSFEENNEHLFYLVENYIQSSYAARNRGIKHSKGEILAFIDADISVKKDWLRRGVDNITSGRGDYIGSCIEIYATHNPPNIWEIYNIRTGFPIHEYMNKLGFSPTSSLFVRRQVFDNIGVFDSKLISGGDREFGNRVRDAGIQQYYDPDNIMKHPARASLRSLFKKNFRIGIGFVDLCNYYPDRYGKLDFSDVIFYLLPVLKVGLRTHFYDLPIHKKVKIFIVANITRFATASGRLYRYLQIKYN